MNINARVSVIIPSFNHRRYVGRAIESVLYQTYPHWECIFIDDGSNDDSYEYVRDQYGADARFNIRCRSNRGAPQTINEAVNLSSGEFISILNSDDFYIQDRLASLVAAARESNDPFFGISELDLVDSEGRVFESTSPYNYFYHKYCDLSAGKPDVFGLLCGNIAMTTSNFFFSRSVFDEVGPFRDLRYSHDWDWALRASAKFNMRRINQKLLQYRIHGRNTILENDEWAHVIDDAFVWASALRREKTSWRDHVGSCAGSLFFSTLASNGALYPLSTLYLLADPRSEDEQLRRISSGDLKCEMERVFHEMCLTPHVGMSMPQFIQSLQANAHPAQSVENAEIEKFDASSGELSLIKKSVFWKVLGWIWRLETRQLRKSRRSEGKALAA